MIKTTDLYVTLAAEGISNLFIIRRRSVRYARNVAHRTLTSYRRQVSHLRHIDIPMTMVLFMLLMVNKKAYIVDSVQILINNNSR